MNELEFILALERGNRQTGRTTAMAKACLECGGIFVVSSEAIKRDMKERFPELDVRVLNMGNLVGTNKPVVLDHYAWEIVLDRYDIESKQTRAQINEYRRELLKLRKILNDIDLEI